MVLSDTRGGYGATERPGDTKESRAGTQRTENGSSRHRHGGHRNHAKD